MIAAEATGLIARWAHLYEDQKLLSAGITWIHLSGILLGGGAAVAADREALRAWANDAERTVDLERWRALHRWVLGGLGLTLVSGLLMLFSDLPTFLPSVLYWTKMGLVVVLLANGYVRLKAERSLETGSNASLATFRRTSVLSIVLWFTILLAGMLLTTL
jgi:predicted ABC-type sugar transport system permease subunit